MSKAERMQINRYREKLNENRNLDLPFIARRDDRIVFWNVEPSGDYALDCQTGRKYAALALAHMIKEDFIPIFTWAIMDMPNKKDATGIEVGFLEFFAEMAIYTNKLQLPPTAESDT